jgi:hypothetical protein
LKLARCRCRVSAAGRRHGFLNAHALRAGPAAARRRERGFLGFLLRGCRHLLWVWLILAAGGGAAAADDLDDALRASSLEATQQTAVHRLFDEAAAEGVPARMLLPRLEEGLAKGAPGERVLLALEREMGYLLEARQILTAEGEGLLREEASWARAANLLAGGLPPEEVGTLVRILRPRPRDFRPATYLYVALVDWGLPREQARSLLGALVGSALPGEEFGGVMELLARGRRLRIAPEEMVRRIRDSVGRARSLDELGTLVLY